MIDKAIEAGTVFDWITPLWTFVQDFRNRPAVGFWIPKDSGESAFVLQRQLRAKGIRTWGWIYYGDNLLFRCRLAQAQYAEYWLQQWDVPYTGSKRQTRR